MGTPFTDIYGYLLTVVEDYELNDIANIDEEEFYNFLKAFVITGIPDFDSYTSLAYTSQKEVQTDGETVTRYYFVENLTPTEVKIIGKISVNLSKRNAMKAKGITDKQEAKEKQLGQAPGEVFAAISMAMHEFQSDVHDVEDTILTITRVKRSYSPWSSKIYTLRETPHKK